MFRWLMSWFNAGKVEVKGSFHKFVSNQTNPKGIFMRSVMSIDPSDDTKDKGRHIVIENLDDEDGEEYTFFLSSSIGFCMTRDKDKIAFSWYGEGSMKQILYIFTLGDVGDVDSNGKLLKKVACECLFRHKYNRKAEEKDEDTLLTLCPNRDLPFDLTTYTLKKISQSAGTTPKKQTKSSSSTSNTPSPAVQVGNFYPQLPSFVSPKKNEQGEEEEVICEAVADLYIYNPYIHQYEPKELDVDAYIVRVGNYKNFCYSLFIEQDGKICIKQVIESEMQATFSNTNHSIEWLLLEPSFINLALVFKNQKEEKSFKECLNSSLFETANKMSAEKLSNEDIDVLLTSRISDLSMTEDDPFEIEGADKFSNEEMIDYANGSDSKLELEEDDDESDDESDDDDDERRKSRRKSSGTRGKNSILADSYKHNRTFVVKGTNIDVYRKDDQDLEYNNSISNVGDKSRKNLFAPSRMMLHNQDSQLLYLHGEQYDDSFAKGKVFQMDLEKQKVVNEWSACENYFAVNELAPMDKTAPQTTQDMFVALNHNCFFAIDPRLKNPMQAGVGNLSNVQNKSNPQFTCMATTSSGQVAVGNAKGEIRMYSGVPEVPKNLYAQGKKGNNPKTAKTLLPGFGDPIKGIDVTLDGRWIVATCKTYLLVIPTVTPDGVTGFAKSMGKNKPKPRRLQLLPEDAATVQYNIDFTPAKFNTGSGELWIATSTGPYLITWNFKKVQQNETSCYTMKKMMENVVCDQFEALPLSSPGVTAPIIVSMPNDVRLEKRVRVKNAPFKIRKSQYKF